MRYVSLAVSLLTICHSAQAEPLRSISGAVSPPPETSPSQRELARECFELGVSLAQAERYAAAKALFLEAYAAEPHYVVLYNIAQVEVQLGNLASAASSLRQYLDAAGTSITPEWRQQVEDELARIEALRATSADGEAAALAPSRGVVVDGSDGQGGMAYPGPAQPALPSQTTTMRGTRAAEDPPVGAASGYEPRRLGGYALMTGGFAVLGGAAWLYVWNHGRYDEWQGENEALLAVRSSVFTDNEAAINARVHANDARLSSIRGFDVVPLITGGVGLAALGAGLWMLIGTPATEHVVVSGSLSELDVRARWAW